MKPITKTLIDIYKLDELEVDMMGFAFDDINKLSYHHTFDFARNNGKRTISNGSALDRDSSHDLIHIIENKDYDMFSYITSELYDMIIQRKLTLENLTNIDELVIKFFTEYEHALSNKGKPIIKPVMIDRKEKGIYRVRKKVE